MEIPCVFLILVLIFIYLYYKFTLKTTNVVPEGYVIVYTRDACRYCDQLKQQIETIGTTLKIIIVNQGSLGNVTKTGEYNKLTGEVKTTIDSIIKKYEANAYPSIHKMDDIKIGLPDIKEYVDIFRPETATVENNTSIETEQANNTDTN